MSQAPVIMAEVSPGVFADIGPSVENLRQYVDWVVLTKLLTGHVDDPATVASGMSGYLPPARHKAPQ